MDTFAHLLDGLAAVMTPTNLGLALLGCLLGMIVGVLPGFGPAAATALLLPVTFTLGPISALIVMAAILYGASYGGTITAVLLNVPGETSSVATSLDGYAMAKQGRGGIALAIAAIGSFIGGLVGLVGFVFATPLSKLALEFGPVEFFALTVFALSLVAGLASKSLAKALISATFGLSLGMIGIDPVGGEARFTFGSPQLLDGLNLVAVVMGLFGLAELLASLERITTMGKPPRVTRIYPTREDLRASAGPIARGSVIGFFMGLLPGSPGAATSFTSYVVEKRFSKHPERFGKGAVEGVAGPETANNSLAITSMIPLFTLGIPTSATMAIMLGAFTINGLVPGPLLFEESPEIAWTIIASMFVGNVILLILNLPLVRVWVTFMKTPYPILYAVVLAFMLAGAYIIDGSTFNIGVMLLFGLIGYGFVKLDIPLAPAALTLVLADIMERALRQSLTLSQGSLSIFLKSPIAVVLLSVAAIVMVVLPIARFAYKRINRLRAATEPPPTPQPSKTTATHE
jgi:putative tricarboxylic transport membrane protein